MTPIPQKNSIKRLSRLLQRYPDASDIRCHPLTPTLASGARISPGARLSSTAAFYATLPGRLGSGQACHVQAEVVEV